MLRLGVVGTSRKDYEQRVPIHCRHLDRLSSEVRSEMLVERGYGNRFSVSDDDIEALNIEMTDRRDVIERSDVLLLFKPVLEDIAEMHAGQVLWGCPHFVLDTAFTQAAIDRRISSITIEGMRHQTGNGGFSLFVFHRVCELAGYASVRHALELQGKTGRYGRQLTACVIGYGSTGRGAVEALQTEGVLQTTVLTERPTSLVAAPPNGLAMEQYEVAEDGAITVAGSATALGTYLTQFDIVVNCVLQNPTSPKIFMSNEDVRGSAPGSIFVDVSCDTGMGFEWASPTTFAHPIEQVAQARYYAVDHSPSLYWDSASEVISDALLPFVNDVLAGEDGWARNAVLEGALEMRDGRVLNEVVLAYQGRDREYPHRQRPSADDGNVAHEFTAHQPAGS